MVAEFLRLSPWTQDKSSHTSGGKNKNHEVAYSLDIIIPKCVCCGRSLNDLINGPNN
jgi:hypothetical protein